MVAFVSFLRAGVEWQILKFCVDSRSIENLAAMLSNIEHGIVSGAVVLLRDCGASEQSWQAYRYLIDAASARAGAIAVYCPDRKEYEVVKAWDGDFREGDKIIDVEKFLAGEN